MPRGVIGPRLEQISGLRAEDYSVLYGGDLLLGSGPPQWQSVLSPDGRFAVELAAGYVKKAFIRIVRWPGQLRRAIRRKKEKRP